MDPGIATTSSSFPIGGGYTAPLEDAAAPAPAFNSAQDQGGIPSSFGSSAVLTPEMLQIFLQNLVFQQIILPLFQFPNATLNGPDGNPELYDPAGLSNNRRENPDQLLRAPSSRRPPQESPLLSGSSSDRSNSNLFVQKGTETSTRSSHSQTFGFGAPNQPSSTTVISLLLPAIGPRAGSTESAQINSSSHEVLAGASSDPSLHLVARSLIGAAAALRLPWPHSTLPGSEQKDGRSSALGLRGESNLNGTSSESRIRPGTSSIFFESPSPPQHARGSTAQTSAEKFAGFETSDHSRRMAPSLYHPLDRQVSSGKNEHGRHTHAPIQPADTTDRPSNRTASFQASSCIQGEGKTAGNIAEQIPKDSPSLGALQAAGQQASAQSQKQDSSPQGGPGGSSIVWFFWAVGGALIGGCSVGLLLLLGR